MKQITVKQLYQSLKKLVDAGQGDKKIVVPDDNEGNAFHGIYFTVLADPKSVKENIDISNGLYDSQETNCDNLVIIG